MISEESNAHSGEDCSVPVSNTPSAGPPIPIAIVGMACRFSGGVTNPSKLWELCVSGEDSSSSIPKDRFDPTGFYHEDPNKIGRSSVKGGYFLKEDVTQFDAAFFNFVSDVANVTQFPN
jgi:acyl transferase domain-containing protein